MWNIYLCFMFNIQLKSKKRDFFSLFPNNKVDIYTWIDSEVSDFLDNAGWAMDVDDSLVDAHFESVPSL
jgi:hypothetical protein